MVGQCQRACEYLKQNQYYSQARALNLVGLSQGGLMARSILEDCDIAEGGKVRNILTIGTPNMGVSEMPELGCNEEDVPANMSFVCELEHSLMATFPYTKWAQDNLAAAGYVRNSAEYQVYL